MSRTDSALGTKVTDRTTDDVEVPTDEAADGAADGADSTDEAAERPVPRARRRPRPTRSAPDADEAEDDGSEDGEPDEQATKKPATKKKVAATPKPERKPKPKPKAEPADDVSGVRRVVTGLLVLTVLLAGACVFLWVQRSNSDSRAAERDAALAASRQAMVDIGTFSYTTFDADLKRILAVTTGDLNDQFLADGDKTKQQVVSLQIEKKATVLDAGVTKLTGTTATVILLVQSEGSSTAAPELQIERFRVQMTMVNVDGTWLASELPALPGEAA